MDFGHASPFANCRLNARRRISVFLVGGNPHRSLLESPARKTPGGRKFATAGCESLEGRRFNNGTPNVFGVDIRVSLVPPQRGAVLVTKRVILFELGDQNVN